MPLLHPNEPPKTQWVKIYSTTLPYEAEMICHLLEQHELDFQVINKQDWAYSVGDIEIYVPHHQALKAQYFLRRDR